MLSSPHPQLVVALWRPRLRQVWIWQRGLVSACWTHAFVHSGTETISVATLREPPQRGQFLMSCD
jgi:hypothetical protein